MTQEQIEGNRIIAEFMNVPVVDYMTATGDRLLAVVSDEGIIDWPELDIYAPSHDWNSLMAAVGIIDTLGYPMNICHNCTEILGDDCPVVSEYEAGDTRISLCWTAVVEFIQWHNELKATPQITKP
jgi:hypothetical protein